MRASLVGFLLGAFLGPGAAVPGLASHATIDFVVSGTLFAPNPLNYVLFGVTEATGQCDEAADLQGFDGHWIKLPARASGHVASLVSTAIDADVWFYDQFCRLLEYDGMAALFGDEHGTVPPDARWALIAHVAGYESRFTFTIEDVQ